MSSLIPKSNEFVAPTLDQWLHDEIEFYCHSMILNPDLSSQYRVMFGASCDKIASYKNFGSFACRLGLFCCMDNICLSPPLFPVTNPTTNNTEEQDGGNPIDDDDDLVLARSEDFQSMLDDLYRVRTMLLRKDAVKTILPTLVPPLKRDECSVHDNDANANGEEDDEDSTIEDSVESEQVFKEETLEYFEMRILALQAFSYIRSYVEEEQDDGSPEVEKDDKEEESDPMAFCIPPKVANEYRNFVQGYQFRGYKALQKILLKSVITTSSKTNQWYIHLHSSEYKKFFHLETFQRDILHLLQEWYEAASLPLPTLVRLGYQDPSITNVIDDNSKSNRKIKRKRSVDQLNDGLSNYYNAGEEAATSSSKDSRPVVHPQKRHKQNVRVRRPPIQRRSERKSKKTDFFRPEVIEVEERTNESPKKRSRKDEEDSDTEMEEGDEYIDHGEQTDDDDGNDNNVPSGSRKFTKSRRQPDVNRRNDKRAREKNKKNNSNANDEESSQESHDENESQSTPVSKKSTKRTDDSEVAISNLEEKRKKLKSSGVDPLNECYDIAKEATKDKDRSSSASHHDKKHSDNDDDLSAFEDAQTSLEEEEAHSTIVATAEGEPLENDQVPSDSEENDHSKTTAPKNSTPNLFKEKKSRRKLAFDDSQSVGWDDSIDDQSRVKKRKQRRMWSEDENEAVRKGFLKFGRRWGKIRVEYMDILGDRSSTQIKDKYRVLQNQGLV